MKLNLTFSLDGIHGRDPAGFQGRLQCTECQSQGCQQGCSGQGKRPYRKIKRLRKLKQFLYLTIQENQCNRHSSTACNQAQRDANQSQNKGFIQDGLPLLRPGSPHTGQHSQHLCALRHTDGKGVSSQRHSTHQNNEKCYRHQTVKGRQ